ncbi:hypothetical protein AB0E04_44725 [Streptomyces sp. NPDC048251]|uniref:hypothetical protein n=1 Tax=Streptomyces sp. NPDC048251 TaxID=3154501 RepID=UPI00342E5854
MTVPAEDLRLRFEEFIREQRRLARAVAGGERAPGQLVQAQELLESARELLARADGVIPGHTDLDDTIEAEAAFTCLALLVPELLTSVGYKHPPPPTFTDILFDLEEARDHVVRSSSDEARADALRSLDDIITLVGRAADAVLAGRPPGLWKVRLDGALRVSRALIPHVATTTAIAVASGASGSPFAAAVSTVGTSLAALLLPTSTDLKDLFEPPAQRVPLVAEHRRAARAALEQRDRLLTMAASRDSDAFRWAEQAQATARLHLRMLAHVPGEDTTQLETDVARFGGARRMGRRRIVHHDEPAPRPAADQDVPEDEQPQTPSDIPVRPPPPDPRAGGGGLNNL